MRNDLGLIFSTGASSLISFWRNEGKYFGNFGINKRNFSKLQLPV